MTSFDYGVLGILGFSVLLAVLRGGIKEIVSLLTWILSFWLARTYAVPAAALLPADVPTQELRLLAAFVGIVLATWFCSTLLRIAMSQLIKATGLDPIDRLIGAVFGVLRGSVIVLVLVLLAGLTSLPGDPAWRNAMFSPLFEAAAVVVLPYLPPEMSSRIHY